MLTFNIPEGCKEGRKYLRNEQDHARKQSYKLRSELKEYYEKQHGGGLHPVTIGVPSLSVPGTAPSDACEDEKVVGPSPVYQSTSTTSKPKHSTSHHSHSTLPSSREPSSSHERVPSECLWS
ncbi:hypothetical protein F4778DRAFT_739816 [Xylariomycetidae sp. FL2044]|nr:hypothetical protein F4778DRAFT_739816 [Xylariomycetidae sp. FL2044]